MAESACYVCNLTIQHRTFVFWGGDLNSQFHARYTPVTDTAEQDPLDPALTADHAQYSAMQASSPPTNARRDLAAEQYAPMESHPVNAASRYAAVARSLGQVKVKSTSNPQTIFAVLRVYMLPSV